MRRCAIATWVVATDWLATLAERDRTDDRGAVSTETAIVTALLAGVAATVGAAVLAAAQGWVDSIPGPG